jgi:RNA polymerase sigma-70 factor (ECF subfamily)
MPDHKPDADTARLAGSAFSRYAAELHRFLLRRLRRPEDADDLAQEVFLRLLRRENAELVRKPQAYLFGIAAHVVREFRMYTEREQERLTFDSQELEHAAEHPPDPAPDELAEQLNFECALTRALDLLPPTHRAVLLLVKRDGLSHEEAARLTHLSVHTVEKYIVEARARLRQMNWDWNR